MDTATESTHPDYSTRMIALDPELRDRVDSWHSGQWSACYSLASTGLNNYVSAEMIDNAADELDACAGPHDTRDMREDREDLACELRAVAQEMSDDRAC